MHKNKVNQHPKYKQEMNKGKKGKGKIIEDHTSPEFNHDLILCGKQGYMYKYSTLVIIK